jgi:uncharacterized protein (DUF2141 family)
MSRASALRNLPAWLMPSILSLAAIGSQAQPIHRTLEIRFPDLPSCTSPVRVAVHADARQFSDQAPSAAEQIVIPQPGNCRDLRVQFPSLPFGTYAVAAFQDRNGNGQLDRNMLGAPTEPWAVSNDARPALRSPNFEEARFAFTQNGQSVTLRLR